SHVDTPAWQSFETRMRARAAERRQAKQQRRLRRRKYALGGLMGVSLGVVSALAFRTVNARGAMERVSSERVAIDKAVAREAIVLDWPPTPAPPESLKAAASGALPPPADWNEGVDVSADGAARPGPGPAPHPAATVERPPTLAIGETPDDVTFPEANNPRPRLTEAAVPPAARGWQTRSAAAVPLSGAAAQMAARSVERPVSSLPGSAPQASPAGSDRQVPPPETAPAPGTTARSNPPNYAMEPAPALANQPEPVASPGASNPAVPSVGTSGRSLAGESSSGTSVRTPSAEPAVRTSRGEGSVANDDPRASVRAVLERYRSAYQRLDAAAARAVWPAVDASALSRAFSSLSSQQLSFEGCSVNVAGQTADATCNGESRVVPKIGGGSETARRTWSFKLRQAGSGWLIERATVK
ncbi:MAG: hypothetical protein ACM36C_17050, partial [Acidobacteriota bacterium]